MVLNCTHLLSLPSSVDINECLVDNGGCVQKCINVPGSYACTCDDDQIWVPENKTCIPRSKCLPACANRSDLVMMTL